MSGHPALPMHRVAEVRRVHAFASDGRRVAWDEGEVTDTGGHVHTWIRLPFDARPGVRLTRTEAPPSVVDQYRGHMLLHGHAWLELHYIDCRQRATQSARRRYSHRGPAALIPIGGA